MIGKGPDAIGCRHCTTGLAALACQVCTYLVCDACGADWTTCREQSGRVVRLGTGARLLDVDPGGRYALVARWNGALRLLDVRWLRWVRTPTLTWAMALRKRIAPPRLSASGRVQLARYASVADPRTFVGIASMSLATAAEVVHEHVPPPVFGGALTPIGDAFWYVTETQDLVIVEPADAPAPAPLPQAARAIAVGGEPQAEPQARGIASVRAFHPLPRKVIHAAHVDLERGVVVAGTWGELVTNRIADGELRRTGRVEIGGSPLWTAVAGPYLAAAVRRDTGDEVIVWSLRGDLGIGEVVLRRTLEPRLRAASLSRDGRYLATGSGTRIVIAAIESGASVTFAEHTDRIRYVRFCGDDHLLVSADDDNRVVVRPRTPIGYARVAMPVEIPDEPVAALDDRGQAGSSGEDSRGSWRPRT